jgi:hypothetical protein
MGFLDDPRVPDDINGDVVGLYKLSSVDQYLKCALSSQLTIALKR